MDDTGETNVTTKRAKKLQKALMQKLRIAD
jgi:hypothetical protein